MSVQNVGIASMFGWVANSFSLFRKNAGSLMSASAITLVLGILICIPMWLVMMGSMKNAGMAANGMPMPPDMSLFYVVYSITMLVGLLLFPPLLIGWFRLCQSMDQGNSAGALEVLAPYRDIPLWLRSIRFALLALLIYVAIFGLFALAFSGSINEMMQQSQAQQLAMMSGTTPPPPVFPVGFFIGYFLFIGIAMFLQFVYMVGFTEVSLRPTPASQALKLAAAGVFKNALQLIVFLFCMFAAAGIVMMVVVLILAMVVGLLSMISPIIGGLVALAIYIPVLLAMYPLMFAGHYFVWKSMLGTTTPEIPAGNESTLSL